jgi:hypothetical protein
MLTEFYKNISNTGFGSPRVLITLNKLVIAVARLKLKNVADGENASEAMEFYNAILVKFKKSVIISKSPKSIAYAKGVKIVEGFQESGGVTLEELFEIMCQEDKQLANYFGYGKKPLRIKHNHKIRDVYENYLKNHSNIKIIQEKPIVLKWFDPKTETEDQNLSDTSDTSDVDKLSIKNKNEKNSENFNKNDPEPVSYTSNTSLREQQQEQEEARTEFRLKLSEKSKSSYELTKEQHDSLMGNNK